MEVIELQRFELRKAKYKSFLRKFQGDFAFYRIMEVFELRRFELERLYCIVKHDKGALVQCTRPKIYIGFYTIFLHIF